MLTDDIKEQIQALYRQLLAARDLTPRYGQRLMIAEIAKTLGQRGELAKDKAEDQGDRLQQEQTAVPLSGAVETREDDRPPGPICVVEAGTGTGKTLAYLLATIPLARALDLKVVIATATIALQEQVLGKDIPELMEGADLDFNVALAKGRSRYLCLSRLDMLMQGSDSMQAMMDLYGEDLSDSGEANHALFEQMMESLSAGEWEGDRDTWPQPIADRDWQSLTVDNAQCSGNQCPHFRRCCFYRARDSLAKADCIVTNHDLVLSDLALGGGVILPDPAECFYVFDEAHHLPAKSNNHFAAHTRLKGSVAWLERCERLFERLQKEDFLSLQEREAIAKLGTQLRSSLEAVYLSCEQILTEQAHVDSYENRLQHTFALGVVPEALQEQGANLSNLFARFGSRLESLADEVKLEMEPGGEAGRADAAEQLYPLLGSVVKRGLASQQLWAAYARPDAGGAAPSARWINQQEGGGSNDIALSASPVLAAENLQTQLWSRCAGAVLTSATLSALSRFDMLAMRAGLPAHTHYLRIPSPFRFAEAARLVVPRIHCDPGDYERHTEALIDAIPRLLKKDTAALMLFSSRRQMQDVMAGLDAEWRDLVLCQDDYQKAQLLKYHRQRVDRGEGSLIFGLASFAEGVDLPGPYCTHVLIAKIPFSVPNDPVESTLAAWVEQQGQNPFTTLAVPDAAFKLLQASGRLLRSESDSGQITLFDERIVNRRYGKQILDSLPPYSRELFTMDLGAAP